MRNGKQKRTENLKLRARIDTRMATFSLHRKKVIKEKEEPREKSKEKINYEFWRTSFASAAFAFGRSVI